uniref:Reverse transcriptase zinc-binding domain-containing protein n=1 Tax=Cannabis sativa TaxID=3483 RepID=A0A803Q7F3_CANSA
MGISGEDHCVLCYQYKETCYHLFFECPVDAGCLQAIKEWLQWHAAATSPPRLIRWIGRAKMSKFKKQVLAASIAGLVYTLWRARNSKIWEETQVDIDRLIQQAKLTVKQRITLCWPKKVKDMDKEWFQKL